MLGCGNFASRTHLGGSEAQGEREQACDIHNLQFVNSLGLLRILAVVRNMSSGTSLEDCGSQDEPSIPRQWRGPGTAVPEQRGSGIQKSEKQKAGVGSRIWILQIPAPKRLGLRAGALAG